MMSQKTKLEGEIRTLMNTYEVLKLQKEKLADELLEKENSIQHMTTTDFQKVQSTLDNIRKENEVLQSNIQSLCEKNNELFVRSSTH